MADITSQLVANFEFNKASGIVAPDSGLFGISGELQGGGGGNLPEKTEGFDGKSGFALEFERGHSEKVVVPNTGNVYDLTGNLSFGVWVKVREWNVAWQCIFAKGNATYRLARNLSTNLLNWDCGPNNGVVSSTPITVGKWVHVIGTRKDADQSLRIYLNGVLDGTRIGAGVMTPSVDDFTLADNVGIDAGRFANVDLQDFRLYDRTLSPADAEALFNSYYLKGEDEFQKIVRSFSYGILKYKVLGVRNTVLNGTAGFAVGENLERVGRDRNLPRYQGEDFDEYRTRVTNAYVKNLGLGGVPNIVSVMEGLGATTLGVQYRFNSFLSGEKGDSSEGLFNLITRTTAGGAIFDGSFVYDGSLLYDSPDANDIILEIVQTPAISSAQQTEIRDALNPIIRASSSIAVINRLAP